MSPESIEETLRQAESAIAKGDMTVASSVAANIADSTSVGNMSVSQIGRLSMVYMQLADSIDQSANTETATDLYDRAFRVNADTSILQLHRTRTHAVRGDHDRKLNRPTQSHRHQFPAGRFRL